MLRTLQMDRTLTPGISFYVANHRANAVELVGMEGGLTGAEILHISSQNRYKNAEVLQFSLSNSSSEEGSGRDFAAKISHLVPKGNGFVDTVISAYSQHHALIIRPDDVWLSILVQFNFFVNANAELLRGNFVAHKGKKRLVVSGVGTRYSIDFGAMSREMVGLMEKNIVDPKLREWILPKFSTTTITDTTANAVIMMATLKAYFSYEFFLTCGIPRVTLEGEKSDWVNILGRLEKLKEYGVEAIAWYHLLHPVISRFVAAFDAPASRENIDFWQRDSGPSYYSGWISAFAVFSPTGEWLGNWLDKDVKSAEAAGSLSAEQFWVTYAPNAAKDLVLDGTPYHQVDSINVPPGYAEVDVKLNDNGELFDCMMTAGMIGMKVSSSRDVELSPTGRDDIVRPVSGWWIFIKG
ncbi:hypothetical protein DFH08DRAFT_1029983 [Mycena albidolilacea]|uniref:Uncharacterized protein n=1 Tax=Mycena albidolilacea TaxID=1033008 RepID=A0AAD6ZH09_9AGAR|nr:hypothetical protein DFH08DRAFT_1029983 [Mycena albidolilacea]